MELNFYYNHLILIPGVAFVATVFLKGILVWVKNGKFNWQWTLGSGGMPSVHSSVVVSLTTAIALKHWFFSDYFAICVAFTVIIIYDAVNVRFEAWQHAVWINDLLGKKKFKESLWHLPSEAFAGSFLWILIAFILYFV